MVSILPAQIMINWIRKYFLDRKEKARLNREQRFAEILALGFNNIEFPIMIIEPKWDLSIVGDLDEFLGDPDICCFEFQKNATLIDANGKQYTWGYSYAQKINSPNQFVKQFTLEELKGFINQWFKEAKNKPDIQNEKSIKELIEKIWDYC